MLCLICMSPSHFLQLFLILLAFSSCLFVWLVGFWIWWLLLTGISLEKINKKYHLKTWFLFHFVLFFSPPAQTLPLLVFFFFLNKSRKLQWSIFSIKYLKPSSVRLLTFLLLFLFLVVSIVYFYLLYEGWTKDKTLHPSISSSQVPEKKNNRWVQTEEG